MEVSVRVAGESSGTIHVQNGLRQGCVMAPVLFNLFFGLVIERWRETLTERDIDAGVSFRHVDDNRFLYSVRRAQSTEVTDFEYADDAVLFLSVLLRIVLLLSMK